MAGIDFQGETEQSLVAALRQGRQEMLGKLYDAYAPVMMGLVSRIVQDTETAEQVLQEAFVTVWNRIGAYDASRERLLTWSLAIARGIALEAVKAEGPAPAAGTTNTPSPTGPQQNKTIPLQKGQAKREGLCALGPLETSALESLYLRGRTCAETAGELGMTEEKLRAVLKAAFTYLKAGKPA